MRKPLRLLFLSLLGILLLSGCGYKLRGQDVRVSSSHQPVLVTGIPQYGPYRRQLLSLFHQYGVRVTESRRNAATILQVSPGSDTPRVLSVDTRNRTLEREASETLTFKLTDAGGKTLYKQETLSERRTYVVHTEALLANDNEVNVLRREMREQLIHRMLVRLSKG